MIILLYFTLLLTIPFLAIDVFHFYMYPFFILMLPIFTFLIVFLLVAVQIPIFKFMKVPPNNLYLNYLNRQMITLFNHLFIRMKTTMYGSLDAKMNQVVYANHTSYTDALCVLEKVQMPMAFTPKISVLKVPFIGQWVSLLGSFPIDRSNPRKTLENMIQAIQTVKSGQNMLMFPEGTVRDRYTNDIENMKAGAFKLVLKSKTHLTLIKISGDIDVRKKIPFIPINRSIHVIQTYNYESIKDISTLDLSNQMMHAINTFKVHKDQ